MEIIDIHSHVFKDFMGPNCDISEYAQFATKLGVTTCLLAPSPCPAEKGDEGSFYSARWKFDSDGNKSYVKTTVDTFGNRHDEPASENPYKSVNRQLLQLVKNNPYAMRFLATPLIHPVLDTRNELDYLLSQQETSALKLHGISTHTGPEDISKELIDLLKQHDKPLMVHTDYFTKQPETRAEAAYIKNDPLGWVRLANVTGIKLVALHGACLCAESFQLAKENPNIIFGISPDLLMMSEPERLKMRTQDYLASLMDIAQPEQLAFDIDYSWNVDTRGDWNPEWDMVSRVLNTANHKGYSKDQIDAVMSANAKRFFKL